MTESYNNTLATDLDWVRFEIGDTIVPGAQLTDEEINAVLAEEQNKYLAAAHCLSTMYARWISKGEGLLEKVVEDLELTFAIGSPNAGQAIENKIASLRAKGARLTYRKPKSLRSL